MGSHGEGGFARGYQFAFEPLSRGDVTHDGYDFILAARDYARLEIARLAVCRELVFKDFGLARLHGPLDDLHELFGERFG